MNVATIRRVFVRGTNWIGDAVMSIPALRQIRRIFSSAEICLMVRPWVRDVYLGAPYIDRLLTYDRNGADGGLSGLRRIVKELRSNSFDLAILLQNAFEAALLAFSAGIPIRLGYATDARSLLLTHPIAVPKDIASRHQAYYYLGILEGAGLLDGQSAASGQMLDISLTLKAQEIEAAQVMLREEGVDLSRILIGLNPGAHYGPAKRWLVERYAALADSLIDGFNAEILIFGAPGEELLARNIAALMRYKPRIFCGRTKLRQLMALIKSCHLFITNDSGPMHLAAALDVPQIAIFGSSDELATGPLSAKATVIRKPVPCGPCFLRECPIDLRCFKAVSVEDVYALAAEKLKLYVP